MASVAKTIIATGVTSGLGFEAVKQLLQASQPYNILMSARNVKKAQDEVDAISFDKAKSSATILPVELSNLNTIKAFANEALSKLGSSKLDYLLLNAGTGGFPSSDGPYGVPWNESLIVNHISQFYLVHLLKDKLVSDKSRILFVSSGAIRNVPDTSVLEEHLRAGYKGDTQQTYSETKFIQLLGAHWWRRQLGTNNRVIAVSPGLIPGTGLGRNVGFELPKDHPDAKSVAEGGGNVLRPLLWDKEFPEDREQFFMTSWGEWWSKDVYQHSLDEALQDKWSWSKEKIEELAAIQAKHT